MPKKTNPLSIASFIEQYYPEYWGVQRYPADECVAIHKVDADWGIFSNFAPTPIVVKGVPFSCTEELFALMKFRDAEPLKALYGLKGMGLKMKSKPWQKTHRREDWGSMIVDAMKFCLMTKYEQCANFRAELERSCGHYIVEDQSSFTKPADAWGTKLEGDEYVGPNLLGRLLMELRDNGKLEYKLPAEALDFIELLK